MLKKMLSLFAILLFTGMVSGAPSIQETNIASAPSAYTLQGRLTMPVDGDQFVNQGGAMGDIQLMYSMPIPPLQTNAQAQAMSNIVAIDVILVPRREGGFNPGPSEVVLARGLRASGGDLSQIQTNFVPPISTCGDYRLMVVESHILQNAVVQLEAGAPGVSVNCRALEYY